MRPVLGLEVLPLRQLEICVTEQPREPWQIEASESIGDKECQANPPSKRTRFGFPASLSMMRSFVCARTRQGGEGGVVVVAHRQDAEESEDDPNRILCA
jgi:hypothetical protein